jgi:hypothetical protein
VFCISSSENINLANFCLQLEKRHTSSGCPKDNPPQQCRMHYFDEYTISKFPKNLGCNHNHIIKIPSCKQQNIAKIRLKHTRLIYADLPHPCVTWYPAFLQKADLFKKKQQIKGVVLSF